MENWIDEDVDPSGFGQEDAYLLRDLPDLGIVMSLSRIEIESSDHCRGRLSTWNRDSRVRIRCRVCADDSGFHAPWQMWELPDFTEAGSLVFYTQCESEDKPSAIHVLAHDALETERRIADLPKSDELKAVTLSRDGKLVQVRGTSQTTVWCLDSGETVWKYVPVSHPRGSHSLSFCACGKLALDGTEQSAQSGSDSLYFSLLDLRTGTRVLSGQSSVWRESLQFSDDETEILLADLDDRDHPRCRWTVPKKWRCFQSSPPLSPPSVTSWDNVLKSLASHPIG